jgi:aspartate aminotransferase
VTPAASAAIGRVRDASRRPPTLGTTPDGVISLAMGEPSEGTPVPVVDAAVAALHAGRTRYAPLTGSVELRRAVADHLTFRTGRMVAAEEVVCTHGASAGLAAAILATIGPGDRVVVPEPTYSLYADQIALAGGEIVWVPSRPDGSIDLPAVETALAGARMLVLCNPNNPTGVVLDRAVLTRLSAAAAAAGALLLSDEAYSGIVFDGRTFHSAVQLPAADHVISCHTFSKSYAMTGWRLGYVIASPERAEAINLGHRTINGALATFVQDAGTTALKTPDRDLRAVTERYQRRRDLVLTALTGLPAVSVIRPQGAFYAFVRVEAGLGSDELTSRLAESGVLVRSGREFGPSGEGAFRLSFATDEQTLAEGLRRIEKVLRNVAA